MVGQYTKNPQHGGTVRRNSPQHGGTVHKQPTTWWYSTLKQPTTWWDSTQPTTWWDSTQTTHNMVVQYTTHNSIQRFVSRTRYFSLITERYDKYSDQIYAWLMKRATSGPYHIGTRTKVMLHYNANSYLAAINQKIKLSYRVDIWPMFLERTHSMSWQDN
jgi:hypothetical protein